MSDDDLFEDLRRALEPDPGIPTVSRRLAAFPEALAVGSVMGLHLFVGGVLAGFSGFNREWVYKTFVMTPVMNGLAISAATLVSSAVILVVSPSWRKRHMAKALLRPWVVMASYAASVTLAAGALILLTFLGILLFQWIREQGPVGWALANIVYAPIGGYFAIAFAIVLLLLTWWSARICIRHWFGAARAHPMLPALAMLVFAPIQALLGFRALASGEFDAGPLTTVVVSVYFAGPVCLIPFALVTLRLLRKAGVRFRDGRTWLRS
jgi:hypothetical protein